MSGKYEATLIFDPENFEFFGTNGDHISDILEFLKVRPANLVLKRP